MLQMKFPPMPRHNQYLFRGEAAGTTGTLPPILRLLACVESFKNVMQCEYTSSISS